MHLKWHICYVRLYIEHKGLLKSDFDEFLYIFLCQVGVTTSCISVGHARLATNCAGAATNGSIGKQARKIRALCSQLLLKKGIMNEN